MKKLLLCLLTICTLFANWQDHWVKGIGLIEDKKLDSAILEFNSALTLMNDSEIKEHPYVLIDLGQTLFDCGHYDQSLIILNRALSYELKQCDKEKAFVTKVFCEARLDMVEDFLRDVDALPNIVSNWNQIEETEDKIIIRNYPDCDCYKKMMTIVYIETGICEKESDIQFLKSGVCIVKKKNKGFSCPMQKHFCDPNNNKPKKSEENCQSYCEYGKDLANVWCGKAFSQSAPCQFVCLQVVKNLAGICNKCCANGNFYGNCVKVFEDILAHIGNNCNPDMDP